MPPSSCVALETWKPRPQLVAGFCPSARAGEADTAKNAPAVSATPIERRICTPPVLERGRQASAARRAVRSRPAVIGSFATPVGLPTTPAVPAQAPRPAQTDRRGAQPGRALRSEEHTSELQSRQ